ncbi:MAG: hypothetical protein KAT12_01635 [Gammaproteobacteria bacterium]|nr:hypothetical protein [Gammaproteobacteria bacterium]
MLGHDEISKLIPHTGDMCLLDTVRSWDKQSVTCVTLTHHKKDNPLRSGGGLPMVALLEYGAQAMAIHGCLIAEKKGAVMEEGYLVALRDVQLAQGWCSDIEDELEINVQCIYAEAGNMIYTMSVHANKKLLASGRATVVAKFSNGEISP